MECEHAERGSLNMFLTYCVYTGLSLLSTSACLPHAVGILINERLDVMHKPQLLILPS